MRKVFLTYCLLFVSMLAFAQATGIPYSCSFEDDEDLTNWVWNYHTPESMDKWIIGNVTHSEGQHSLYISSDGRYPVYGNKPNIVVSYLRFKFPTTEAPQENYDISFDWRGVGDSAKSRLYVMVCAEQQLSNSAANNPYYLERIVSSTNGTISPTVVAQACQQLGESKERFVCGSEQWTNVALSNEFKVSRTNSQYTYVIVLIWVNSNNDENVKQSGICVDNLQISTARIKKPQNVNASPICEDSVLLVTWESGLDEFEVQYRKVGAGTWRTQDAIMNGTDGFTRTDGIYCSYKLQRIGEASYDVRVKGIAGNLISNYSYQNNVLVYCPENHCVNYLDLHGSNVLCTYGYHPNSQGHPNEDPYTYEGVLDYGPDSEESRHTIHTDPTELDPRADSCLLTVPPGALASVRLGNWKQTGEAEAIAYSFDVDAENQGILIVKYATVVEYSGHERSGEPFFRLEVLDEQGNLIDESCGHADYAYSDAVESGDMNGWNISKNNSNIAWKDWTTVGVNLQPYAGQTITVRFTTSDCYQTAHYGYAYFTVDCASARLETENCGNDAKIECFAPEGFSYKWFNEAGKIVGTDRELVVDPGRQEYTCRVSFLEDSLCYFEVKTLSAPRFPVPDYTVEPIYENCSAKLKFHNTSHVMNKYEGFENHTNEPTEDCHWYFTSLKTGVTTESPNWSPVYTCDPEGDSIVVYYQTYIGLNNACDTGRVDTFVTRSIISEPTYVSMESCEGEGVLFGGKIYDFRKDTVYVGVFDNFAGCDSTSTLTLKVWPKPQDSYRHDSICSDQSVMINGVKFNQPVDTNLHIKTIHGCDSVLHYKLTVNERLKAEVPEFPYACADDEVFYITYAIDAGVYDSLEIKFDTPSLRDTTIYDPSVNSIAIPYPANILPGHYTATVTFHQFCCGKYIEHRAIDVRYRASVVEQKWNDVLTLLAPKYNGGYDFTAFQWYKNDEPIEGATHSYLYQDLDFNSEYYVVVTRPDGVSIATCPITPKYHEQQTPFPTIVPAGQQVPVYREQETTVWYYTVSGQYYGSYSLPQGYSMLTVPADRGIYILKSVNASGETQAQKMIVE